MSNKNRFMESTKSYYLYELQEKYTGQDWMSVIPRTYSIDGNGTMPRILKSENEEICTEPEVNPYRYQYFTFESLEDDNRFSFNMTVVIHTPSGNRYVAEPRTISASTDGGQTWLEWTSSFGGTHKIMLNAGEKLLLKGENDSYADVIVDEYGTNIPHCVLEGEKNFKIYGNIMSLVSGDNFAENKTITKDYAFYFFLSGKLTTESGVTGNFNIKDISNLVLPATTLTKGCYYRLFSQFASITTAPELPATTLGEHCYEGMFLGCTSLTTAPALPATTLAEFCYQYMFNGCTSLTTAPELPATTLAEYCYRYMFNGCTSLNYIKCLATDISAIGCTTDWVNGVSSTGTFVKKAAMTGWTRGKNGIPTGWTIQNA